MMRLSCVLAACVLTVALRPMAVSQQQAMPDDLSTITHPEVSPTTAFFQPSPPAYKSHVSVAYDNKSGQNSVTVVRRIRFGGAKPLVSSSKESLSVKPIATTAGAYVSSRLFVAGWSERDGGALILEEWHIPLPVAVAEAASASTGVVVTTAVIPPIRRSEFHELDGVGPIWGMTVNPHGGEKGRVLLLEYRQAGASTAAVWEFDIETSTLLDHDADGVPDPLWTGDSHPEILNRSNIWAAYIPSLGFLTVLTDDTAFDSDRNVDEYAFFIDTDLDGSYEVAGVLPAEQFLEAYPFTSWASYGD